MWPASGPGESEHRGLSIVRSTVDAEEYLGRLPPVRSISEVSRRVGEHMAGRGQKLIVLDDDTTGTQSVHGVPVLTTWTVEDLRWALGEPGSTFFVLTNTRSRSEAEAVGMNREISANLVGAARGMDVDFVVASRSDSTLRGHYPAETDALSASLPGRFDGVVLCPCFFEAGRITAEDVQWVRQGEALVPAGETEFARDATFGYASSNLEEWVEEKTAGRFRSGDVVSVGLDDVRGGGPDRVEEILRRVDGERPVVVNAVEYADLEVFVLGLIAAEAGGKRFLYRTGPSFVRVRGGISAPDLVSAGDLYPEGPRGDYGLVVVGSHVAMTTRQLERAVALGGSTVIELSVERLLGDGGWEDEVGRVSEEVNRALGGSDVILYTSRKLLGEGERSLDVGRVVSDALVEVVRRLDRATPLRYEVAKGGITSSDVGTRGLGVRRAEVAGTMLPGIVPVWILPEGSHFPGIPYVIFPGNVGDEDSLARVMQILRRG